MYAIKIDCKYGTDMWSLYTMVINALVTQLPRAPSPDISYMGYYILYISDGD